MSSSAKGFMADLSHCRTRLATHPVVPSRVVGIQATVSGTQTPAPCPRRQYVIVRSDSNIGTGTSGILSDAEIARVIQANGLTPHLDTTAAIKWITWNNNQWYVIPSATIINTQLISWKGLIRRQPNLCSEGQLCQLEMPERYHGMGVGPR